MSGAGGIGGGGGISPMSGSGGRGGSLEEVRCYTDSSRCYLGMAVVAGLRIVIDIHESLL